MMKKLTIQGEQTLFDIAIQEYGKTDSDTIWKLLLDNPNIAFDYRARQTDSVTQGRIIIDDYEVIESGFNDLAYPLTEGQTINIDPDYPGKENSVLKKIEGKTISTGYAKPLNN